VVGPAHGKVKENLARGIRHKAEHNERVRFQSPEEEKHLRAAIAEKF
jgi:hypothetical protein